ncbi:MAG: integron cassette protein [Elusimicrobia bacterium CG1_02_63_36]|nr:MAG: integron cassette protein [Elusimicrobia bacterium CG1_02_63_36]PIP81492.1 MAG: integron cassette protein [Elusimicrobia bacterium CG22_combo_CG10-13_8_21_14_all_63_91]PJA11579.1 MAG: hypothetical protein COX66_19455 [Elusimicrobia bacterium CG_4_10_14_0_2_um_filter_63_34]PJB24304.1 MAG: hypothetical protein CO113_14505 [Elusimicrobia bacterium CG_4_9_14_3_um_filter_62_55]
MKGTSQAEILDISPRGVWLFAQGKEYFLPYGEFPWFADAKVSSVYNVQLLHGHHLHWPDLDVDLDIESLSDPKQFPLKAKNK